MNILVLIKFHNLKFHFETDTFLRKIGNWKLKQECSSSLGNPTKQLIDIDILSRPVPLMKFEDIRTH